MLSVSPIHAGLGIRYLTGQVMHQDQALSRSARMGYYTRSGYPEGVMVGRGAEALGIEGDLVVDEKLEAMFGGLEGPIHPVTGERVGQRWSRYDKDAGRRADAGFDLTFSPPKSVSVLWGLGSERVSRVVEEVHERAWRSALSVIEDEVAATRRGKGGLTQVDVVGITGAAFRHYFSRAGDPDIHEHVAVWIMTQAAHDQRWTRLDSDALYRGAAAAGEHYTASLMDGLSAELGVRWTYKEGYRRGVLLPEIEGIPKELLDAFSQRRVAIEARAVLEMRDFAERYGRAPTHVEQREILQAATLGTRPKPESRNLGEHRELWAERSTPWDGRATARRALGRGGPRLAPEPEQIAELVAPTIGRLLETHSMWTGFDVRREAARVLGQAGFAASRRADVLALVEAVRRDEDVYGIEPLNFVNAPVPRILGHSIVGDVFRRRGEELYTHKSVLDAEAALKAAVHTPGPFLRREVLERHLAGLDADQRAAVVHAATSARLVDAVVGLAGSGKTTALKAVADAWREGGHEVVLLAATGETAQILARATGMAADTLAMGLKNWRSGRDLPRPGDLVVVDEASMAATPQLGEALAVVRNAGAALWLVGDPGQLDAVGPGGGFGVVVREARPPFMRTLHRFSEEWEGRATQGVRAGDPAVIGVYEEHDRIHAGTRLEMIDALHDQWRAAVAEGRDAVMGATRWRTVDVLNELAQHDRVEAGEVALSEVVLRSGAQVGVGDVVVTTEPNRRLLTGRRHDYVRNHDRWIVEEVREDESLLVRRMENEAKKVVLPADYVSQSVTLGYAATTYGVEGGTCDASGAILEPGDERDAAYVLMTRGRFENHAFVVTAEVEGADELHLGPETELTARMVLEGILAKDEPVGASQRIEALEVASESLQKTVERFEHLRQVDLHERLEGLTVAAGAPDMVGGEQWARLLRLSERYEAGGRDVAAFLAGREPTAYVEDLTRVNVSMGRDRVVPRFVGNATLASGPNIDSQTRAYLDELRPTIEARWTSHVENLAAGIVPSWAESLGPAPAAGDLEVRFRWSEQVATVAIRRERIGWTDEEIALPPTRPRPLEDEPAMLALRAAQLAKEIAEQAQAEMDGLGYSLTTEYDLRPRQGPSMGPTLGM